MGNDKEKEPTQFTPRKDGKPDGRAEKTKEIFETPETQAAQEAENKKGTPAVE
jgi:hypothetical protein